MSEEQIREQDEEVMEVVNRGKDTSAADAIIAGMREGVQKAPQDPFVKVAKSAAEMGESFDRVSAAIRDASETMKEQADVKRKLALQMVLRVIGCILAAGAFLALMLDTRWVPVVAYAGIGIFVVMGAIILDRHFCRRTR